jgi:hypothetical protein
VCLARGTAPIAGRIIRSVPEHGLFSGKVFAVHGSYAIKKPTCGWVRFMPTQNPPSRRGERIIGGAGNTVFHMQSEYTGCPHTDANLCRPGYVPVGGKSSPTVLTGGETTMGYAVRPDDRFIPEKGIWNTVTMSP